MHDRARHLEEVNAIVSAWTSRLTKEEAAEQARRFRIPCAPVRDVSDVMHDPHMHGRGMLEWVDHPDLGRVVLPTTPIRLHNTDVVAAMPRPHLGQDNDDVYGGWLGLAADEIAALRAEGVIWAACSPAASTIAKTFGAVPAASRRTTLARLHDSRNHWRQPERRAAHLGGQSPPATPYPANSRSGYRRPLPIISRRQPHAEQPAVGLIRLL